MPALLQPRSTMLKPTHGVAGRFGRLEPGCQPNSKQALVLLQDRRAPMSSWRHKGQSSSIRWVSPAQRQTEQRKQRNPHCQDSHVFSSWNRIVVSLQCAMQSFFTGATWPSTGQTTCDHGACASVEIRKSEVDQNSTFLSHTCPLSSIRRRQLWIGL